MIEEGDAVDELHREEPLVAVREQLVQGHEVGMGDVGQGPELLLEAIERAPGADPQRLEGDVGVALPVQDFVDDAEGPGAQPPLYDEAIRAGEASIRACMAERSAAALAFGRADARSPAARSYRQRTGG